MRNLGLDIGDKRIGIAISDPEEILATPLTTIVRDVDGKAIEDILGLINQHKVQRIVVGLPYSLDGSIGKQANKIMTFVKDLSRHTEAAIEVQDERLSSVAAEQLMREAGVKSSKIRERRDAAAAAFILQGYLDSLKIYEE